MSRKIEQILGWVLMLALANAGTGCGSKHDTAAAPAAPVGQADNLVVPERAGLFTEATQHYGPLVVSEGEFFAQADDRPWSGYWYPLKDDLLVAGSPRNGGDATLAKFDKWSKQVLKKNSTAVDTEIKKRLYYPMAENWEGRCGAWAIAAVMEAEPSLPTAGVQVAGTDFKFFTRDVKALLIKSYETVDNSAFHRFGQVYEGDPSDDYQDIYPDQFHRVLMAELFERHRAIVMDDTAGVEVWNTPVWQVLTTLTRDPSDPHVMHVSTRAKGAQSVKVSPDYSGPSNDTTYQYTYDLFGSPQADGSLLVKYGKWTGDSFNDHPDFVLALPPRGAKIRHASENDQLEPAVLDEILSKTHAFGGN